MKSAADIGVQTNRLSNAAAGKKGRQELTVLAVPCIVTLAV